MIDGLREEFPVLATAVYLNSNSMGASPRGMQAVYERWMDLLRTWRDEYVGELWDGLQGYHASLERFLGADPGTVVTDANVSALLGRLATAFDFSGPRRRVILTDQEFPSAPWIWQSFRRFGAEPVVATWGDDPEGAIEALLDERVRLVCVSHGSFRTGAVLDLARISRAAHAVGAVVIADAYQTVGVVPVDVKAADVDFLLGGAHKWLCGALDSAFLYAHPRTRDLVPAATGWMASADPFSFGAATAWAEGARRFAAGTPAFLPALTSQVGLDLLAGVGIEAIRRRSLELTAPIFEWAEASGVEVLTPKEPQRRGGVVSLRFPGAREAAARLVASGMICSFREALRVAPHVYNTHEEVGAFLAALERTRREVA